MFRKGRQHVNKLRVDQKIVELIILHVEKLAKAEMCRASFPSHFGKTNLKKPWTASGPLVFYDVGM